jgi:hypothetical protein
MGIPFRTRLFKGKGLYCPKDLANQHQFICEACVVRAVDLDELGFTPRDIVLLMLERARIIDTSDKWAAGTLKAYQSK